LPGNANNNLIGGTAGAIFNTGGGALSLTSVTLADNTGRSGAGSSITRAAR
jgi:hypothetical protein